MWRIAREIVQLFCQRVTGKPFLYKFDLMDAVVVEKRLYSECANGGVCPQNEMFRHKSLSEECLVKVTVLFTPWFSKLIGADQKIIELDGEACIEELMHTLIRSFGITFERLIMGSGRLPGMIVLRNGEATQNMSEKLADGDTIQFIMPLSGG